MATPKYRSIKLGPGDLSQLTGESQIYVETYAPTDGAYPTGDGKDGDMWIQVSGASSNFYQKANNVWTAIAPVFSITPVPLTDGAVNQLAFTLPVAQYASAVIEYYILAPGGVLQRGEMTIVNDGVNALGTVYSVMEINGPLGVTFDFVVNGANLEIRYDSDLLGLFRTLVYRARK